MSRPASVVVGCHWLESRSELAFVARSIAGAASRCGPVAVLVPGVPERRADGAFDLEGLGPLGGFQWPDGLSIETTVIVDDLTAEVAALLARVDPQAVQFLSDTVGAANPTWRRLSVVGGHDPVGLHVPVNRLAEHHRHHGFGFTDYLLVLSGRTGDHEEPPAAAAWLSAAFSRADVVVLEDAVASAWKGRALRGQVPVDTRMDLWRLLAHANVCIDLAPGAHIARECVEALRFGTPVIVPAGPGPGAAHALVWRRHLPGCVGTARGRRLIPERGASGPGLGGRPSLRRHALWRSGRVGPTPPGPGRAVESGRVIRLAPSHD